MLTGCDDQRKQDADLPIPVAKAVSDETTKPSQVENDGKENDSVEVEVGGFKFMVPAGWEEKPRKTDFILSEFSAPGDEGPARVTLSSAGMGVDANLLRWRQQFVKGPDDPGPRQSEFTFCGKQGQMLELAGTYSDMLGSGAQSNQRMIGIGASFGDDSFFIKMTGPATTVSNQKEAFIKFAQSARSTK